MNDTIKAAIITGILGIIGAIIAAIIGNNVGKIQGQKSALNNINSQISNVNDNNNTANTNIVDDLSYFKENISANEIGKSDSASEAESSLEEFEPETDTSDVGTSEIPSILFLSEEYVENATPEKIIEDNMDFILQRKNEYAESDITRSLNNYVEFRVYEEAARINHVNDGNIIYSTINEGINISNTIIILLDYETDDIIYNLITDKNGMAEYHPISLDQKIYYVAIAPNYNLKVSEPIIFDIKDREVHYVTITLLKENDEYTSDFQIALKDSDGSAISNREKIYFNYILKENKVNTPSYYWYNTNEIGYITSYDGYYCFFELNTRYLINTYLDLYGEYRTVDGSITNTNLFTVQFDYDTIEE